MADVTMIKRQGLTLSGDQLAPAFMQMPADVFINICEWLSVRDIICLRMANKQIANITQEPMIWISVLRRLTIPFPTLPPIPKYSFGEIDSRIYEWLVVRALYLKQNWHRQSPYGSHSGFEGFGRTISMKMLPGGRYLVTVTKDLKSGLYSLLVWNLDHAGKRVALTANTSMTPFLGLVTGFGVVKNHMSIVIAYTRSVVSEEGGKRVSIKVYSIPIYVVDKLVELSPEECHSSTHTGKSSPFSIVHQSMAKGRLIQLALGEFDGGMVLLLAYRDNTLVFHYLESGKPGVLLLDRIDPHVNSKHSIWNIKLLTGQNSVLVSRVQGQQERKRFTLDIFPLPDAGSSYKGVTPTSRQVCDQFIDGIYFSDLDTSWFASMRDPGGLLPAPINKEPPPISIFITMTRPRGIVQCIMQPQPSPHQPGGTRSFIYRLPAVEVYRNIWYEYARPVVVPGAYCSIIWVKPQRVASVQRPQEDPQGKRTTLPNYYSLYTYATGMEKHNLFSTLGSTGNLCKVATDKEEALEVQEEVQSSVEHPIEGQRQRGGTVRIPKDLERGLLSKATALAFEESTGQICFATNQDTSIHVLDFGGETWNWPL